MSRQAKNRKHPTVISWRFAFVVLSLSTVFVGLVARAAYLQVLEPDMLVEQGDLRSLRVKSDEVLRGMILDRNGEELAVSVPVESVYADSKVVIQANAKGDNRRWHALAEMLQITPDQLTKKIATDPKKRYVYLQRHASPATVDYIRKLKVPGIYFKQESRRYYPTGEVAAHILGFTNIDDHGVEGVERQYDQQLKGIDGRKVIRKDAKGREIEVLEQTDATQSRNLQLSIDQRIQAVAYRELKKAVLTYGATSGSIVVVDVHSGEVLAMVNSPSYNPNNRKGTAIHRFRNRSITDTFEPGSTIKPLPVLAALENGTADLNTIIPTGYGPIMIGGARVQDVTGNGDLDLKGIIRRSSNIGVTRLALNMPHEDLLKMYYGMGLGDETGLGLMGESGGQLRERARWSEHERAALSFGYGLSVTAVQLARMYSAIANGGTLRPLTILKTDNPPPGVRVVAEHNADAMVEMLEGVTEKRGTATRAKVPGYRVGGKTGTAKKAIAGGYGDDYIGSFVGIGPISQPRLACVVIINEPSGDYYGGGEVAAPVFSAVMGAAMQLLNLPPDGNDSRISKVTGGPDAG
ncbi:MAG: peptidoglycan glycosyltransferase FtsI [Gammaproteobacteria bacterium]|jgi:cell division protein FtsI (penicillin-binding protein 3)|nr:peptidoglycan glycosyltransferase FtsI [Gammaproteobacteria bacterium]